MSMIYKYFYKDLVNTRFPSRAETETEKPIALVTTDLIDLKAEPETEEPVAPMTTVLTDLIAEPETEEPVALVTTPTSLTWKLNPRAKSPSLL